MSENHFNHPDVVANTENLEQALLATSLQNCEPYVFPGTVDFHLTKLIELKEANPDFDIENFNEKLAELASLRVDIDQPNARQNEKTFSELLNKLTKKAEEINTLAGYKIIIDPKLTLQYRHQKNDLEKNLTNSGFTGNIKNRMLKELDEKINKIIAEHHFQHISRKIPGIIDSLKKTNNSFNQDNELPFINALKQEFNITATD